MARDTRQHLVAALLGSK